MILIGASTGGPGHLKYLFSKLSGLTLPPVVIAQHMDAKLMSSFASYIGSESGRPVTLVQNITQIESEGIYVCERTSRFGFNTARVRLEPCGESYHLYNPSIDILFDSACVLTRKMPMMGILLTGIGHDGAAGLTQMYRAGAECIAESEASAIVYGMPKKALEFNPAVSVQTLDEIVECMRRFGARYVV